MIKNDLNKLNRKCPIINENTEQPQESTTIDSVPPSTSNNDQNSKLNSKVTVSIQSNEEKAKENVLSSLALILNPNLSKNSFFFFQVPEKIHEYCKRLFEFDVIKVKKFK
jgi:hypothetical protein